MDALTIFTAIAGVGFLASAIALVVIAIRQAPDLSASLVIAERRRQQEREGYGNDHDDEHTNGELAAAAACYAMPDILRQQHLKLSSQASLIGAVWPWCKTAWKPTPEDRVRELTKAGALILAELDRELRVQERADWEGGGS